VECVHIFICIYSFIATYAVFDQIFVHAKEVRPSADPLHSSALVGSTSSRSIFPHIQREREEREKGEKDEEAKDLDEALGEEIRKEGREVLRVLSE
jgi:hypothetical protein